MAKIFVVNSKGEKEFFSVAKVLNSARRVGASRSLAQDIAVRAQSQAYDGIPTSEIFSYVKSRLKKDSPRAAMKFNLKKAMAKLGPTGFPFEKYIAEILRSQGFVVEINQIAPGHCCSSYEIDFLARKENLLYIGECKFRNVFEGKVHMDVALANYARFLDIKNGKFFSQEPKTTEIKSLLVTNAKFTNQAIRYCECCGVGLLGWKYPQNNGLERLIDSQKLYPITILPSFNSRFYQTSLAQDIILARDLLCLNKKELAPLIREAKTLLEL